VSRPLAVAVAEELREIADLAGTPGVHTNLGVDFIAALARLVEAGADNAVSVGVEYGANAPVKWDAALRDVAAALGINEA